MNVWVNPASERTPGLPRGGQTGGVCSSQSVSFLTVNLCYPTAQTGPVSGNDQQGPALEAKRIFTESRLAALLIGNHIDTRRNQLNKEQKVEVEGFKLQSLHANSNLRLTQVLFLLTPPEEHIFLLYIYKRINGFLDLKVSSAAIQWFSSVRGILGDMSSNMPGGKTNR